MMWWWSMVWVACAQPLTSDGPVAQPPDGFWDHWGDGRAELDAYRLTTPRYGELRQGEAVQIWVTETFTHEARVKSDGGHDDEYPVLKLNDSREFQTGIYDYDVMTSTFVRLDGQAPLGEPVKVSMTMAEWCGHVYEQVLPRDDALRWTGHSYFDGEADQQRDLKRRPAGLVGDAAPMVARGVVGGWVEPGAEVELDYLPTLVQGRVSHTDPSWGRATLARAEQTHEIEVPAGTFVVRDVTLRAGGRTTTWQVEVEAPHRIIRWERSDGEVAELVGSERLAYWQLNGSEGVRHRVDLGLPAPQVPSTEPAEDRPQPAAEP